MNKISFIIVFCMIYSFSNIFSQSILFITDNIQAYQSLPMEYIIKGLYFRKHKIRVYSAIKPNFTKKNNRLPNNILSKILLNEFPSDLSQYTTIICSNICLAKKYIYLKENPVTQDIQFITIVKGDDFVVSEFNSSSSLKKVALLGDLFLAASQHARYLLDLCEFPQEKIELFPLPVDCAKSIFRINIISSKREIKILIVDEFPYDSGVEIACRALQMLNNVRFSCTVVCSEKRASQLRSLFPSRWINFVKVNSSAQFLSLLQEHQMLIMTPTTSVRGVRKGIPFSLLEAMAHGLLIVASRHGGIPEVIKNNENGYLVPERDHEMLAEAIQIALSERQTWPSKILRSREIILERHERLTVMKQLHTLLIMRSEMP